VAAGQMGFEMKKSEAADYLESYLYDADRDPRSDAAIPDSIHIGIIALRTLEKIEIHVKEKLETARKWKNWSMIMEYEELEKFLEE
jgi:hypothetical protein